MQVLFECGHGKYWYLGDRVLPQVYHTCPSKAIPVNLGILGDYLEFFQIHLQGCLIDAFGASMSFLFSQFNSYYLCYPWLFVNNLYMFRLQASVHGVGGSFQDKATPSPQGNVDGPNASFTEEYPNFLVW